MAEKLTFKQKVNGQMHKFKLFLKRNMTKTWAKRVTYQIIAFLISVSMIVGVAIYAFNKTYDERSLTFVDGFTITAHAGAYDTEANTLDALRVALDNNDDIIEVDVRQRPDGTVVISHDIVASNSAATEIEEVFKLIQNNDVKVNLDIKETKTLSNLHNLIYKYELQDRVFLTGIDTIDVNKVKENCPDIAYYLNYSPSRIEIFSEEYQQKILDLMEETGAIGINCNYIFASRTLSKLLHDNGYKLSEWTVDKKFQMKRALINRPDNITSRHPDKVREVIEHWGK